MAARLDCDRWTPPFLISPFLDIDILPPLNHHSDPVVNPQTVTCLAPDTDEGKAGPHGPCHSLLVELALLIAR